jgi:hypothetical protein
MARRYAGILALIAFLTVLVRAAATGQSVLAAVKLACASLFAFALIGAAAGWIASRLVDEAVHSRLGDRLEKARQDKAAG